MLGSRVGRPSRFFLQCIVRLFPIFFLSTLCHRTRKFILFYQISENSDKTIGKHREIIALQGVHHQPPDTALCTVMQSHFCPVSFAEQACSTGQLHARLQLYVPPPQDGSNCGEVRGEQQGTLTWYTTGDCWCLPLFHETAGLLSPLAVKVHYTKPCKLGTISLLISI